ncbi:uncharacterized protein LOC105697099 [Orussus abietinus]|uniref:uncharacterized protein LOC105697099 n=1 Tax=Orussus abietinus TaxID=222816 RepID=UPI000625DFC4|nr:uncharacterized protein LOC105697099 [Orussus abietinus]
MATGRSLLPSLCGAIARATAGPLGTKMAVARTLSQGHDDLVVPKEEVVRFVADCLRKVGASPRDADVVGHHLMTADYRGHFSHGMNRVFMYVKDVQKKVTDPAGRPEVVVDFQAIAVVDGKNGMGQVIGKFCMELAIEKAKKFGIGMVAARGSNHYGICGYYSLLAMERKMLGFTCTNTSPLMAPARSTKAALGTNPMSLGMGTDRDQFVLDMATTAVALGKIQLAIRKEQDIPEGWALDPAGRTTTDAKLAYRTKMLMPLGGAEENSGYKGFGLALLVEVLCGVLGGSSYGPNIRLWDTGDKVANLGHCFIAVNPEAFGPGHRRRLDHLLQQLRDLPNTGKRVMVAGDPERQAMAKVDRDGGISYHENQIEESREMAKNLGVREMGLVRRGGGDASTGKSKL